MTALFTNRRKRVRWRWVRFEGFPFDLIISFVSCSRSFLVRFSSSRFFPTPNSHVATTKARFHGLVTTSGRSFAIPAGTDGVMLTTFPHGATTNVVAMQAGERITAVHFTDPGCPWAYSARPAHARLAWRFGRQIEWRLVMIGLSETAERYVERGYTPERLAASWPWFQARFGMPFTAEHKPRMAATSRACRAIVAAREIDPALGERALRELQLLQFTTTRLLDEDSDLRDALAGVPGLDADATVARIDDPEIVAAYEADRALARSAEGSPTHAQDRSSTSDGPVRFTAPSVIFERPDGARLEVGGFQPFEAYDTALANLDVSLERRAPPSDARDALSAFPDGLTTAEAAAVLRPSDLVDADLDATEAQLTALAEEGTAARDSVGGDAGERSRTVSRAGRRPETHPPGWG